MVHGVVRSLLLVFTIFIACPIRYWAINSDVDDTWAYALNYAAAHGLAIGRDVVWTTGPLGYLAFPEDIGNNLAHGLLFQSVVWLVLIAILVDLFFRARLALRNLALFTLFLALSAPLYWFNYMGVENLLLMGVLVLLVIERMRGGWPRYVVALALIGVIALIKVTAALIAAGAVAGYLADRLIRLRSKAWPAVALAATVPLAVAGVGCWLTMPSFDAFLSFLKASIEITGSYSVALSRQGHPVEWVLAIEVLVLVVLALLELSSTRRDLTVFFAAALPIPLFFSLKHGFIRQDAHVVNFFCFAGVVFGLIALGTALSGKRVWIAGLIAAAFLSIVAVLPIDEEGSDAIKEMSGLRGAALARDALFFSRTRVALRKNALANFQPGDRLGPVVRGIIGSSPMTSVTQVYSYADLDGSNLRLYPVIQNYQAYTPYLDNLNAAWVRNRGPRYIVVDWAAIDDHHPWTESPAMWDEIYRWYNTRVSEGWVVLLERRTSPRFERFETIRSFRQPFRSTLVIPDNPEPIFWRMRCGLNGFGILRKFLFRVSDVQMTLSETDDTTEDFRIVPEVLSSPVMGNYLPNSLDDVAAVFAAAPAAKKLVDKITFGGPGIASYGETCEAELLRTVP